MPSFREYGLVTSPPIFDMRHAATMAGHSQLTVLAPFATNSICTASKISATAIGRSDVALCNVLPSAAVLTFSLQRLESFLYHATRRTPMRAVRIPYKKTRSSVTSSSYFSVGPYIHTRLRTQSPHLVSSSTPVSRLQVFLSDMMIRTLIGYLSVSLVLGSILPTAISTAGPLTKRESGLKCPTATRCTSYYTTGSAQCSTGYQRTLLEVRGYPQGSYCEKSCDTFEKAACTKDQCQFYSGQCSTYPGNSICGSAMERCGTPIAMPEKYCNSGHLNLREPVAYDSASGTCDLAKIDPKSFDVDIGPTSEGKPHLYLSCNGIAPAAIQNLRFSAVWKEAEILFGVWKCTGNGFKSKNDFDPAVGKSETHCTRAPERKFDSFEKRFKENCEKAVGGVEGQRPVFTSRRT